MGQLTIKVGISGDLQVDLPITAAGGITLGEHYVAHEESLPDEQRLKAPSLDDVKAALARAKFGHQQAQSQEMKRAESAGAYHVVMTEAKPLLKEAAEQLEWKYRANPAILEQWGLPTKIGARGKALIVRPKIEPQFAKFLTAYVAREQSLPEADRLTTPSLDRLAALSIAATQHGAARVAAADARQIGVETRSASLGPLLDRLQLACGLLVVLRYDGYITKELQAWGFKVTAVPTPAASEPPVEPQA